MDLPPGPLAPEASGARIRWKRGDLLGAGASARVYMGLGEDDGTLMAVKQVPFDMRADGTVLRQLQQEIKLLSQLSHPNVVSYLGAELAVYGSTWAPNALGAAVGGGGAGGDASAVPAEGCLYIFMELVPGGSLASLIRRFGRLNERLVRRYTRQVLQGLAFLHEHGVIHRDVKGGNILVDRCGECKLSDFGASQILAGNLLASGASFVLQTDGSVGRLDSRGRGRGEAAAAAAAAAASSVFAGARAASAGTVSAGAASVGALDPHLTLRGTPCWMAPEVIRQVGYGRKSDVWSVGCTVIEMLTGKPPWGTFDSPGAALYAIASATGPPPFPPDISEDCRSFLTACLCRDPSRRPTVNELLTHPFVAGPLPPPGRPLGDAAASAGSTSANNSSGGGSGGSRSGTPGTDGGQVNNGAGGGGDAGSGARPGAAPAGSPGNGGSGASGQRRSPSPDGGYGGAGRTLSLQGHGVDLMGLRLHREGTSLYGAEDTSYGGGQHGGRAGSAASLASVGESLPGSGAPRAVNPFSRTFAELQQQQQQQLALAATPQQPRRRGGSQENGSPESPAPLGSTAALAPWQEDGEEDDESERAAPTLRPGGAAGSGRGGAQAGGNGGGGTPSGEHPLTPSISPRTTLSLSKAVIHYGKPTGGEVSAPAAANPGAAPAAAPPPVAAVTAPPPPPVKSARGRCCGGRTTAAILPTSTSAPTALGSTTERHTVPPAAQVAPQPLPAPPHSPRPQPSPVKQQQQPATTPDAAGAGAATAAAAVTPVPVHRASARGSPGVTLASANASPAGTVSMTGSVAGGSLNSAGGGGGMSVGASTGGGGGGGLLQVVDLRGSGARRLSAPLGGLGEGGLGVGALASAGIEREVQEILASASLS